MRFFALLAVASSALAGLVAVCVIVEAPAIEADLSARTSAALAAASVPAGSIAIDGRDVTLGGVLVDDRWRAEAETIVRGVNGVRAISFVSPESAVVGHESAVGGSEPVAAAQPLEPPMDKLPEAADGSGEPDDEAPLEVAETATAPSREPATEIAAAVEPSRGAIPTRVVESSRRVTRPSSERAVQLESRIRRFLRGKKIEFQNTKAELLASSRDVLRNLAPLLAEYPEVALRVEGYTDSRGRPAANLDLSQRRAETIRLFLIARGIAAERLTAVGRGPVDPIADNGTPEGRRANRRIEFHVED